MAISQKERDNILRWNNEQGWYEVYYLKFNDEASRTAHWLRYTMTSPLPEVGEPYCELWGIFFDTDDPGNNFAVKNRYPIDHLSWEKDRFHLAIAKAEITQNACHGEIVNEANGHSISWDLKFDSEGPTNYQLPDMKYYEGSFPGTKFLSPHMNARFEGTIVANGREIKLKDAPGQQTHIYGLKHALRWCWGHCNTFKEEDAVWEGLDAQIMLGPIPSPHFSMFYLKTGGKEYRFIKFPFPDLLRRHNRWKLGHWTFKYQNKEIRIRGEITSRFEDFVAVTYTDTDGKHLWCNNSKVSTIKIELSAPDGTKIKQLTSDQGCAAEYVERKIYPEVPVRI